MKPLLLFLTGFLSIAIRTCTAGSIAPPATAPSSAQAPTVVPLWPTAAPGALGADPVKDVPTLTLFLPAPGADTSAALIICPGGGYTHLAPHEGAPYAIWLNQLGVAGLVLKYRLGSNGYRHPVMLEDIQRAIRLARFHADDWRINPKQIGVMGSSAGGHLASTAMTHFDAGDPKAADPIDRLSCRPDLAVLCYPVITMGPTSHSGSRANLLGKDPSPALIALLSNELQVTPQTPPCFIWGTADDAIVPISNSLDFGQALSKNKVPFELHIFPHGPHGQGLGVHVYDPQATDSNRLLPWTRDLRLWLKGQNFCR